MANLDGLKRIVNDSNLLWQKGDHQNALKVLDDALEEAIQTGQEGWIRVLSHHAAVLADSSGDLVRAQRYYEGSLTHCHEATVALFGLSRVLLRQGDTGLAKQYALRCRRACLESSNEEDREILRMLESQWPDLASEGEGG